MARIYVHPLPVRIWHWINALGFVAMIVTGLQIRYIGLFDLLSFRTAVVLHEWIGFVLIANFFVWLLFYLFSDKIRVYHPELSPMRHFRASFRQALYYGYGIFKGEPNPHHVSVYQKFNSMQSMSYQVIMLMLVPIQFVTGLLLWDVKQFSDTIDVLGGVRVVDTTHVLITIFFAGFLPVHIYLATLGHTRMAHIMSMFTGYEEVGDEHGGGEGTKRAP